MVKSAEFISSSSHYNQCPKPDRPEYAFIGRSNVGKSSLINLLTNRKKLAKTSSTPGKTQLINHFEINKQWYLVDLPGYGYAKVSKQLRGTFHKLITDYVLHRKNLMCLVVLLDSRLEPQKSDLDFMEFCGQNGIPFVMCFTKIDKLTSRQLEINLANYRSQMLEIWEDLPQIFSSSATAKIGQEELLNFIEETNGLFQK